MSTDLRLGRWQDVLDDVPDGSVRLLLTSPPYDNARTYEGTNEPVDFGEMAAFALRVLCPGGTLAMVLDGAVNDGVQSVSHLEVAVAWSKLPGWRLLQILGYGRQGAPGEYLGRFRKDHEPLFVFVRDGAPHVCEKIRVVEIWSYSTGHGHDPSADTGHPATFAEAFAIDAVTVWSNPGDLICDPFAGSATVAYAARSLGRSFVGAERVKLYHEIGMRRLDHTYVSPERAAEPVGALFAPR